MTLAELRSAAHAALAQAREIKEEFGANMDAAKMEEFNKHMDDFAKFNDMAEAAKNQNERFAALDAALEQYNAPVNSDTPATSPLNGTIVTGAEASEQFAAMHMEAFNNYVRYGAHTLSASEQRAFLSGRPDEELAAKMSKEQWAHVGTVDTLGGLLVPEEFMAGLLRDLAGASVMRRLARVQTTSRSVASFLSVAGSGNRQYSSGLTGSFRSEGWTQNGDAMPVQNQPRFGKERVPVHIWSPDIVEITMELLEDAGINLEAEIRALLTETRIQDEESAFILGNGVGMPTGISFEAEAGNITAVNSGAAAALTYDGLINMYTELPAQYLNNATLLMNSKTWGAMLLLKDNDNRPLFPVNAPVRELLTRPIEISEFMPDIAAGVKPIIFGDFNRGYGIADRMDLRVMRLNERYAPNVGLMAIARVGGQMVREHPFVCQNIAV